MLLFCTRLSVICGKRARRAGVTCPSITGTVRPPQALYHTSTVAAGNAAGGRAGPRPGALQAAPAAPARPVRARRSVRHRARPPPGAGPVAPRPARPPRPSTLRTAILPSRGPRGVRGARETTRPGTARSGGAGRPPPPAPPAPPAAVRRGRLGVGLAQRAAHAPCVERRHQGLVEPPGHRLPVGQQVGLLARVGAVVEEAPAVAVGVGEERPAPVVHGDGRDEPLPRGAGAPAGGTPPLSTTSRPAPRAGRSRARGSSERPPDGAPSGAPCRARAGDSPARSSTVPATSTGCTRSGTRPPAPSSPGRRRKSAWWAIGSHSGKPLPKRPCWPASVPWSETTSTAVRPASPRRSSVSRKRPQPAVDQRHLAGVQRHPAPRRVRERHRRPLGRHHRRHPAGRRVVAPPVGLRRVPRLVGVEAVQPEEEPGMVAVALQPAGGGGEEPGRQVVRLLLRAPLAPVAQVLAVGERQAPHGLVRGVGGPRGRGGWSPASGGPPAEGGRPPPGAPCCCGRPPGPGSGPRRGRGGRSRSRG